MYSKKLIIPNLESDNTWSNNLNNIKDSEKKHKISMHNNKYGGSRESVMTGSSVLNILVTLRNGRQIPFWKMLEHIMDALNLNPIKQRYIRNMFAELSSTQFKLLFDDTELLRPLLELYTKLIEVDTRLAKEAKKIPHIQKKIQKLFTNLAKLQSYSFIVKRDVNKPLEEQCRNNITKFVDALTDKVDALNHIHATTLGLNTPRDDDDDDDDDDDGGDGGDGDGDVSHMAPPQIGVGAAADPAAADSSDVPGTAPSSAPARLEASSYGVPSTTAVSRLPPMGIPSSDFDAFVSGTFSAAAAPSTAAASFPVAKRSKVERLISPMATLASLANPQPQPPQALQPSPPKQPPGTPSGLPSGLPLISKPPLPPSAKPPLPPSAIPPTYTRSGSSDISFGYYKYLKYKNKYIQLQKSNNIKK